ncbi:MAG: transketolase [Sumerlaeia bacterium]
MTTSVQLNHELLAQLAKTIRGLAIDGVEAANSGHPGMPLGCADFAALLWYHHLNYDSTDPDWPNRDRFVLSAGHGSMLIYSMLHLTGQGLTLDDLRQFRQLHSKTPGHPENFMTKAVETTTGPLGQGFGNAVGMALSAEMAHVRFPHLMDHTIYGIVSDGDIMEGVSAEAASFAGHHKLGRLVLFYDDNNISIEGSTELTFSGEDVAKRFEAYGWHVIKCNGHNFEEMHAALTAGKAETTRPTLICGKTQIGFGSPNRQGTAGIHGSPLGPEEMRLTKINLGLDPEQTFVVPQTDRDAWAKRAEVGKALHQAWKELRATARPDTELAIQAHLNKPLGNLSAVRPSFDDKALATRKSGGAALNAYAKTLPWLIGGSADLAPSTNTLLKDVASVGPNAFEGRNLHYGIREHAMGSINNGIMVHGFFRPYGATFLVFSDYMRPTIRLAALMGLPVINVFTHDSIFVGEDGPTHQPVEHVAVLRAIPNNTVIRPGDSHEAAAAWEAALENITGPTNLILTRQNLPTYTRGEGAKYPSAEHLKKGGYTVVDCAGTPEVIIIGTGSELHLAVQAAEKLNAEGHNARAVSMPCVEFFKKQPQAYRDSVLPPTCRKRVVVEAGIKMGWESIATDEGVFVTQETFGASGPAEELAVEFGFTLNNVVEKAKALLA